MNQLISDLFNRLHENPEPSGLEFNTKKIITDFMDQNTSMEYHELAGGFYYVFRVRDPERSIALRADYDAVSLGDGKTGHFCGHDGHSSALCMTALKLMEKGSRNNVFLLFQSSEENGNGAKNCLDLFDEKIDAIYGQHNLPGFPFGKVYTSENVFACASCGMILDLKGRSTHAAYPELGVSPAEIVSRILDLSKKYRTPEKMITIIEVRMGEEAFGVMAHEARICLTLRSTSDRNLNELKEEILSIVRENGERIAFEYGMTDCFPATVNHPSSYRFLKERICAEDLREPMRWSEDFAYYLLNHEGAFFGIGSGEDQAPLHSEGYCYPKELIPRTAEIFYDLCK